MSSPSDCFLTGWSGSYDPGWKQMRLGGRACCRQGAGPEPGPSVEQLCLFRDFSEIKDQR